MPLFYQHNINQGTKLAIWQIEEPEAFFLEKVPLIQHVSHPHKRLQHLAGRYLLPLQFDDFPLEEILIADTLKPFLEKEQYHFSISHCGNFASAIVSKTSRVGVDVEKITPRILSIRHKFLSSTEYELITPHDRLIDYLTLIWSAKEAVFKWHGKGKLDFKQHIVLREISPEGPDGWVDLCFEFKKDSTVILLVKGRFFEQLSLGWVVG